MNLEAPVAPSGTGLPFPPLLSLLPPPFPAGRPVPYLERVESLSVCGVLHGPAVDGDDPVPLLNAPVAVRHRAVDDFVHLEHGADRKTRGEPSQRAVTNVLPARAANSSCAVICDGEKVTTQSRLELWHRNHRYLLISTSTSL